MSTEEDSSPKVFLCVRVASNGDAVETVRDEAGMKSWLDHNRLYRFGYALFVNGNLAGSSRGYLSESECARIGATLATDYEQRASSLVPETTGPQIEWVSGQKQTRHGYAPEKSRTPFTFLAA